MYRFVAPAIVIAFIGIISLTTHEKLTNTYYNIPGDTVMDLGKKVFLTNCNICHRDSANNPLAPSPSILSLMTPKSVWNSLQNGKMKMQAVKLTDAEKKAVAQFVTKTKFSDVNLSSEAFVKFPANPKLQSGFDYSGWGGNLEGTGFRNASQAGITKQNVSTLKLKWALAFPQVNVMRTKAAVAGDWLIVGGQYGDVYAINKNSGKIGWTFNASAAVRGAITVVNRPSGPVAFFVDYSTNAYAVNIKTGKLIWNKRAGFDQQSMSTGSVAYYGGRVFVPISSLEVSSSVNGNYDCCVSSGGLVALDAATGNIIWKYRVVPPAKKTGTKKNGKPLYGPSGAPVWCSPTIDAKRGYVYIGTGENYSQPTTNTSDAIQAVNMKTGKLVWNFQSTEKDAWNLACPYFYNCPTNPGHDLDFGMAPIIIHLKNGKDILVAGQKAGLVFGIDPDKGKKIWETRVGKGGSLGGVHWGIASDGKLAYVANSDNVIALDNSDSTIKASPGLFALDVTDGKMVWKAPSPDCNGRKDCYASNSAAPVVVPGLVFAGGLDGHIRAYSTDDGKILWDFDTVKDYDTLNSVKPKGGAIDGPPPVIFDGMLIVNSGYAMFGQMGGNLILAFEVDKKGGTVINK